MALYQLLHIWVQLPAMTTLTRMGAPPVPPARKTPFASVGMTLTTRDAMNRLALDLGAKVGRRVSLSALTDALMVVGRRHEDELAAALAASSGGEPS